MSLGTNDSRIKSNINIHGWNVHIPAFYKETLISCGFTFNGEELESTMWLKKDFTLSVKTLDKLGFEWECRGSFNTGMYIKTTDYKA